MLETATIQPTIRSRTAAGRYLYCLIAAEDAHLDLSLEPITAPNNRGGTQIYTIVADKLAAVVSDSPVMRYPISKPNLLTHERVLEHVMSQVTALPVKYGTVTTSQQDLITKLLLPRQQEVLELLAKFRNKAEVSVKAMWEREKIFAAIAAQPEIIELQAQIASKSANASQQDKIDLGQTVERLLNQQREADAELILARLTPLAHEFKLNPITLDMLVLNAAFLVAEVHREEFDRTMDELDEALNGRMRLRYAGPLPPYNFMRLNLAPEGE